jgi:hypothetical protein
MEITDIKIGKTRVVVKKKDDNNKVSVVKDGVILQVVLPNFVRVFDPRKGSGDAGDGSTAELFPWKSDLCWVEPNGQVEEKVNIPVIFRN